MNAQLIRNEGHQNTMTLSQLQERMAHWIKTEYQALLFESESKPVGKALGWLQENRWGSSRRVRIDVLIGNHEGMKFWRRVGFQDYCLTMEKEP